MFRATVEVQPKDSTHGVAGYLELWVKVPSAQNSTPAQPSDGHNGNRVTETKKEERGEWEFIGQKQFFCVSSGE